jgi:hypothetical protein
MLPPLFLILFLFLFLFLYLFLLLHANGVVVSHLFPAAVIGATVGAIVPQKEAKMASRTTTMATMNEMHHSVPSTPPYNPRPRKSKGGGHCHGSWW